jgi:Flp pilus assembly protein TadB
MDNREQSLFGAIATIVGIAVLSILGLTALFWVAGLIFHVVRWAVHVAVILALAFFFCRIVARRCYRTRA